MSFFVGRDGNISVLRVAIVIVILGVAVIIGGFLLFQLELRSFNTPLKVDVFPGAVELGAPNDLPGNNQTIVYQTDATPEDVFAFYDRLLAEHNGDSLNSLDRERCNRIPLEGQFEDYVEGSGNVPYQFTCGFTESGWNGAFRDTVIKIQPGVRNDELAQDTTGSTIIVYEQHWN